MKNQQPNFKRIESSSRGQDRCEASGTVLNLCNEVPYYVHDNRVSLLPVLLCETHLLNRAVWAETRFIARDARA